MTLDSKPQCSNLLRVAPHYNFFPLQLTHGHYVCWEHLLHPVFIFFFQLLCSADALCPSKKLQEFSFFLLVVDTHSIRKLPKMSHLNFCAKILQNWQLLFFCFTLLYLDGVFNLPPLLVNNQTNIAIQRTKSKMAFKKRSSLRSQFCEIRLLSDF